jgi:hypothetical protein
VLLTTSTRFPEDELIQRMASEAVVNISQLGADDSDDPKKVGSAGLAEVVVRRGTPYPPPPSTHIRGRVCLAAPCAATHPSLDRGGRWLRLQVPIKKAFLTKQGGAIKTWHKRWFVLDSQKISYYKGQEVRAHLNTYTHALTHTHTHTHTHGATAQDVCL